MPAQPAETLSPREEEVVEAVAQHLTNTEIARRLHLSVRTVESHVSAALRKLGASDRRELAALAAGRGGGTVPGAQDAVAGRFAGLPRPRASFVGRAEEVATLARLVRESAVTTVVGPGGSGKTRLAVAATEHVLPWFVSGGAFVDLVPAGAGAVTAATAAALGVGERPGVPLDDAIASRLRGRALLVLDNAEHVVDDVAQLVEHLLARRPDLHVLVTSRERLGIPGEAVVLLGPVRDDAEATTLFLERARAVSPSFQADDAALAYLCRRLDGSPLAIELAAARAPSLGLAGIDAGLDDVLSLLARGRAADRRHRSLRAVVEWSVALLDADETRALRRVSVFAGSFGLDDAAAVDTGSSRGSVADLLGRLVDKSLVRRDEAADGSSRWSFHVGVRDVARELLDAAADGPETWRRHEAHVAARAQHLVRVHRDGVPGAGWTLEVDALLGELRPLAARTARAREPGTGVGRDREPDRAQHALLRDLAALTFARGLVVETQEHLVAAAASAPTPDAAAEDLADAAACALLLADAQGAFDLLRRAATDDEPVRPALAATVLASAVTVAERFRGGGFVDPPDRAALREMLRVAETLATGSLRASAHVAVARAWTAGDAVQHVGVADADHAVGVARATGDVALLSAALDTRSTAAAVTGRPDDSLVLSTERLDLLRGRRIDVDPLRAVETIDALRSVATYAVAVGALDDALAVSRRAELDPALEPHPCWAKGSAVVPLALSGAFDEALDAATAVWEEVRESGRTANPSLAVPLLGAALAAGLEGSGEEAVEAWWDRARRCAGLADLSESPNLAPWAAFVRGRVSLSTGTGLERALAAASAEFVPGRFDGYASAVAAEVAVVLGAASADDLLERAERYTGHHRWVRASLARARGRRVGDAALLASAVDAWEWIGARYEKEATRALAHRLARAHGR